MVCPECKEKIDEVLVDFDANGEGALYLMHNTLVYEELEVTHEYDRYICPKCNYDFSSVVEAEQALRD